MRTTTFVLALALGSGALTLAGAVLDRMTAPAPAQAWAPEVQGPAPDPVPEPPARAWRALEPLSAAVPAIGALRLAEATGTGDARYDAARAAWVLPPGSGIVLRLPRAEGESLRAVRVHIEDAPGGTARASLALWRGGVPEVLTEVETAGSGYYQIVELRAGAGASRVSAAAPRALGLVLERDEEGAGPALVRGVDVRVCTEERP